MKFIIYTLPLILFYIISIVQSIDPYQILGVDKNADERTIKTAYKQLSKKYHPDKNPSEEAHEKFIEIGEAYEILNDKEKKSNYDNYGDPDGQPQPDLGDLFSQFFGGGGGGGQRHQQRQQRGGNTQANLRVSLLEFYRGKELDFHVEMTNICSKCEGTGSKDKQKHTCSKCDGSGVITMTRQFGPGMVQRVQMHCDECGGKGNTILKKCGECQGKGSLSGPRHYNIYLKPGTKRNDHIILEGEGEQEPDIIPGDLIISIHENFRLSWGYRRIGNNLYRTEVLSLKQAMQGGWNRSIKFFDEFDHEIKIGRKLGEVIINNEIETIKGKGMPILERGKDGEFDEHDDNYGDLFIEYKVLGLSNDDSINNDDLLNNDEL